MTPKTLKAIDERENSNTRGTERRVVFVGRRRKAFESIPNALVCTRREDCSKLLETPSNSLWISWDCTMLLGAIESWLSRPRSGARLGHLLLMQAPQGTSVAFLRSLFDKVVGDSPSYRFLPLDEMLDVLGAPLEESQDLFIGGFVDQEAEALVLIRGDFRRVVVPLSMFAPTNGTAPDPSGLAFTDFGQTVKLEDCEAASDAILYESDADFRRRLNARRHDSEVGFGPSLRRIRKQMGVKRTDFDGVNEKTIARIERGETTPRSSTRKLIEKRLGMSSEKIETF